ncbi:LacI family transcriptional regulator [Microbacterium lushaniae]|nr:LacI family transcriptional regulator [Microbacterium lushaniae]KAA9153374.1 LacI family transcriptional regulator [Microbacterium lushaniae]
MAARKATLRDVAAAAGVSTAAASFALRGKEGVSPETRARVLEVARELSYEVNLPARSLRTSRYGAIGLRLPEGASRATYYTEFAFGVVDAAEERGLSVILLPHLGAGQHPIAFVDGFIVVDATASDPGVRAMLADGRPVVSGEHVESAERAVTASVVSDHDAAMHRLLDHLAAQGAAHIGVLLPPETTAWGRQVASAYAAWSASHGKDPAAVRIGFVPTVAEVEAAADAVLSDPAVDALVVVPSGSAAPALSAALRAGRVVGEDLLLAAYVDEPVHMLLSPAVTAFDLNAREFGGECLRLLVEALAGDAGGSGPVIRMTVPSLVVRESSTRRARP